MYIFKDVTLLITHYNRFNSLKRLLETFQNLNCSFSAIVVSDDGSKQEILDQIIKLREKIDFTLVTAPSNKGLGNNINKGQDAITTSLTLYVQEDFVPLATFPTVFSNALDIMRERKKIDMIRFYAYFLYPNLKPLKNGFSEMFFSPVPWRGYRKFYLYSDHPHLRRNNFFDKFGRYRENIKVEATEYNMMMSFLKNKGKALFYEKYTDVFSQENSSSEPSTIKRNFWRESRNPLITLIRHTYRYVRFNLDLLKYSTKS